MSLTQVIQRLVVGICLASVISAVGFAQISMSIPSAAPAVTADSFQAHHSVVQGGNRQSIWKSELAHANVQPSGGAGLGPGTPTTFFPVVYPGFLSNPANKPVMQTATQHLIFVNSPTGTPISNTPAHWGNPQVFLNDLNGSGMIHMLDEYVLTGANNRYPVSNLLVAANGAVPHIMHFADISGLLHNTAQNFGSGLGHIYHVFLPQGQDFCFDTTPPDTDCYSPDIPNSWTFCAFHSFVTFTDAVGTVVFTVEPYQQVNGCAVTGTPTPNPAPVDSTASVLSHELFETVTDPLLNAWYNRDDLDLFGAEIGDECQSATFNYGNVLLANFHLYEIQSEYSNIYNGCSFFP